MDDLSALSGLPLFSGLGEEELGALLGVFEERSVERGEVLFEAGARPAAVLVLTEGSLSIRDASEEVLQVLAPAQVGELSALTGEDRNLTAVATEPSRLLAAPVEAFEAFLDARGTVGGKVYRNLLRVAARKIGRDRRRLREMKENIVSTQRAMKDMREALLDSEDTALHATLFEELDSLVEQNRKIHYLVEPSRMVPTDLLLDDGRYRVTALSNEWLYFTPPSPGVAAGDDLRGVLSLQGRELPVSGKVENVTEGEICVYLDNLIDEYDEALQQHLSRAQLLDTVL